MQKNHLGLQLNFYLCNFDVLHDHFGILISFLCSDMLNVKKLEEGLNSKNEMSTRLPVLMNSTTMPSFEPIPGENGAYYIPVIIVHETEALRSTNDTSIPIEFVDQHTHEHDHIDDHEHVHDNDLEDIPHVLTSPSLSPIPSTESSELLWVI